MQRIRVNDVVFMLTLKQHRKFQPLRMRIFGRAHNQTSPKLMSTANSQIVGDGEMRLMQHSNPDAALILLFGWAGCNDRYLAKYAKFYEKNFSVLRFTADIQKVRSFSSYRKFALDVYEKILETTTALSIYCHMFSMNGCSTFCALWDLLDTVADCEVLKSKFKGLIFDSSPAYVSPWQAAAAISFALLPPSSYSKTWRETYRFMLAGYFSLHRSMIWLRSQWDKDVYERNYSYFRMLAMKDLPKYQLYIYSSIDSICSAESIEQFIASEQEKKAVISKLFFDDTLHCQHYRLHPDEYEQACIDFVNKA
uniref:Transmembrane protein 53 n=1 Tax=Setaria digitata TaxID=48799 RepID=A0A915PW59_9BILA